MAGDVAAPPMAAAGEPAFTPQQLEEAQRLMDEQPRIDAALKNFLSLKLAEGLAPPRDKAGDDGDEAAAASRDTAPPDAAALQGCARVLLKTVNALQLPPSPQWSRDHPQGADEAGFDYMARIAAYRVVQALWSRCLGAGQKPARLLGKSALAVALPLAMAQIEADFAAQAASAKASEEHLRQFLAAFQATVTASATDGTDDVALTWTTDMKQALGARHAKRQAEAAERVERAATNEDFAADLRSALVGGNGDDRQHGPIIEEVAD
eukprot:TRINITY_DN122209_c0_g1_i1.p1 TRINITY_DN122209_c0_g1~~TRINITY_DN122209_c0_g1_i1.p1  ORF type:complete len:266 (+),score=81.27 TRINITY_DN122209_c0_g1_i1:80-877(+)